MKLTGRELRSTVTGDGTLRLELVDVEVAPPADDEIVVRVEAAPINPSDIGVLLGPADVTTLRQDRSTDHPILSFDIPEERRRSVALRVGQSLPVGNEGAGTVVAAGADVKAFEGKRVGMFGGAMYADYRRIRAAEVAMLPDGASAAEGAAMFVNPLTALGFVETARRENHRAIVHTAAASNLGQMLQRICLAEGIPLVNIVRSAEQEALLRAIGATHVLNSTDADFRDRLVDVIDTTGATVAFDAIGGGSLGGDILQAMERAAVRHMASFNRYGSDTFKQLYIYGMLDTGPTVLDRLALGFNWSMSGWLLMPFLGRADAGTVARLRQRVVSELTTTFASHYTRTIGLAEALDPATLRAYERKATGEKFLIAPISG